MPDDNIHRYRSELENNRTEHANLNLKIALIEQRAETLSVRVDKLEASNTRLMWIVIGAVMLAGLNIIMGGPPLV